MRLLLIEDELRLAENIIIALRDSGFAVDHAADGDEGLSYATQGLFDTIILDLMLPGRDGQSVLRILRQNNIHTPVLILTAVEGKQTLVQLLNTGADDYLAKPFDLGELIARIKALIRRSKGASAPLLKFLDIQIDTVHQTVSRGGMLIDLSPTEYRVIEYLGYRPMAIVSKRELLEHLYDYDWEHHSNVIEAHLSNLRRKLGHTETSPVIETIRHRGYRVRKDQG